MPVPMGTPIPPLACELDSFMSLLLLRMSYSAGIMGCMRACLHCGQACLVLRNIAAHIA